MMLLRKYMSLLGVGSALIDLILPKDTYSRGETINGHFFIKGGITSQQLKRIECDLVQVCNVTGDEKVIDNTMILSSKELNPEENSQVSFTFQLPDTIPATSERTSYRFKTRLTFKEGVESKDQDLIQVI
ncbi:sporulation protein [Metabacillus malikii]|uniref:Sporulation-control protein n=1 Tax=Metabacillus malikii TaxID=1504265 RepID=A0ABT9ZEZ2_9BACI|nr:sporulation protein [Metabacillus malikii]MDQ0229835.1 sporulation-control protein [Metabacillus malikii]